MTKKDQIELQLGHSSPIKGKKKRLSRKARKYKKSIIKEYGIIDDGGLLTLEEGMKAFDLSERCQEVVDQEGLTVRGDRGQVKAHPLLAVIRDARAQFLQALKQLNLDTEPLQPGGKR